MIWEQKLWGFRSQATAWRIGSIQELLGTQHRGGIKEMSVQYSWAEERLRLSPVVQERQKVSGKPKEGTGAWWIWGGYRHHYPNFDVIRHVRYQHGEMVTWRPKGQLYPTSLQHTHTHTYTRTYTHTPGLCLSTSQLSCNLRSWKRWIGWHCVSLLNEVSKQKL